MRGDATFLHGAAEAAREAFETDQQVRTTVFCLYDFDAAGERAARAVREGLPDFPVVEAVERLAVTEEQVKDWGLPTRPAKRSDPEAHKFGHEAVELDAIPPDRLVALVEDAIAQLVDPHQWRVEQQVEHGEREGFQRLLAGRDGGPREPRRRSSARPR